MPDLLKYREEILNGRNNLTEYQERIMHIMHGYNVEYEG